MIKIRERGGFVEKEFWKPGNMLYPLPVVMVSCQEEGRRPNIITVAWTGTVCTNPPMVYISVRPERYSYGIIRSSGEFVINLTTKRLARATDFCGVRSGREIDKFEKMGLTPLESETVSAPGILESPVNIECKVAEVKELGSHHMFLAQVAGVRVDKSYMDGSGRFDLSRAEPLIYSHGEYYEAGERLGKFGYSIQKPKKERKKR